MKILLLLLKIIKIWLWISNCFIYIYIYQLGLSETYQPLIDSYDEKMFSVFVGILSTSVELQDNLTNEEYFKEFEW